MKLYKVLGRDCGSLILQPMGSVAEPDAADFAAAATTFTSTSLTLLQPEQIKRESNQDQNDSKSKPFFPSRQHPRIFTRSLPNSTPEIDENSANLLKETGINDEDFS